MRTLQKSLSEDLLEKAPVDSVLLQKEPGDNVLFGDSLLELDSQSMDNDILNSTLKANLGSLLDDGSLDANSRDGEHFTSVHYNSRSISPPPFAQLSQTTDLMSVPKPSTEVIDLISDDSMPADTDLQKSCKSTKTLDSIDTNFVNSPSVMSQTLINSPLVSSICSEPHSFVSSPATELNKDSNWKVLDKKPGN